MKSIILFYLVFISTNFSSNVFAEDKVDRNPFATFVMIHFEAGGDSNFRIFQDILKDSSKGTYIINNRSLAYQKALWNTAIKLVQVADKYKFKLSLALNPQWAEFILKDEQKIKGLKTWINNGHELAFHHHGINHIDWNGYSNRAQNKHFNKKNLNSRFTEKLNSTDYRGTVKEGFGQLKKLALKIDSSYKIKTGCITDTAIDKPDDIFILTKGSLVFDKDFISKPTAVKLPNREKIYWLNHYQLRSNFNTGRNPNLYSENQNMEKTKEELNKIKKNYNKANHDEIVGIVFHLFDYYRAPQIYTSLFKYIASKKQKVETIKTVQERYIKRFSIETKQPPQSRSFPNSRFKIKQ